MPPQQSYDSNNQYDFIVSPGSAPKKSLLPSLGDNASFTKKIIVIIGGAVILIIIMWIVGTLLSRGGSNTADLTKLVQQQEEIARVSAEGTTAARTDIRNAATNTKLSLTSQQQEWLQFLAGQGTEIKDDQQKALENAATDEQLEAARSNNTFDKTFSATLQSYLNDYAATIQTAFDKAGNETERELLRTHFLQVQLLLEQLPKI